MVRKVALSVLLAVLVCVAAVQAQSPVFRYSSTITNAASGLQVLKNAEQDCSVKVISGDGSKNVTLIRFQGLSAESDCQVVYRQFKSQGEVLGLEW